MPWARRPICVVPFSTRPGVYLLFSDTLGVREVPTLSGDVVEELQILRLEWNMLSGTAVDSFVCYPYADIEAKRMAARFVQEQVLVDIPEMFYPYSFLLVDSLLLFEDPYGDGEFGEPESLRQYVGMQAMAIAVHDITGMSAEEMEELDNALTRDIIVGNISAIPDEAWSDFYEYSEEYYDINSYEVPDPILSVGFLELFDTWDGPTFNTRENDVLAYVQEVFNLTEEEFRTTYAEYPIVISKMEVLVEVLQSYGVHIYE